MDYVYRHMFLGLFVRAGDKVVAYQLSLSASPLRIAVCLVLDHISSAFSNY